jgi:hypothetical protein
MEYAQESQDCARLTRSERKFFLITNLQAFLIAIAVGMVAYKYADESEKKEQDLL